MDFKQRMAIQRKNEEIIYRLFHIPKRSGIYLFHRLNEEGKKCFYVGQAKNLLQRVAGHLMGREAHIDKSIYKHKLYSEDNPCGWRVNVIEFCPVESLDRIEQYYIKKYLEQEDCVIYNVTGGGQFDKKADIGERQQTKLKSFKNGKDLGYKKAIAEVKVYFEKYLDFKIKGKETKIKQKKYKEFEELLSD